MKKTKKQWINEFRKKAEMALPDARKKRDKKKKSEIINSRVKEHLALSVDIVRESAKKEGWTKEELLNEILLLTYASYIVILEYRNKVWPYEYMTFARRIGELWEPFCKIPFMYSLKELTIVDPWDFSKVEDDYKKKIHDCIDELDLQSEGNRILRYYELLWEVINSNKINLAMDLHFEQGGKRFNCDFKSGFSSNEKGNVNRLLLVGCIYKRLIKDEKSVLFVRQEEAQNNNYLQTLKQSEYWECYCSDDCYAKIAEYTGFNLRMWLDKNVEWEKDFSEEFRRHLKENNLLKYLTW